MFDMYDHTDLIKSLAGNSKEDALMLYHSKISMVPSGKNEILELKRLLNSINSFLFSYFCIVKSISLGKLYHRNLLLTEECHTKNELVKTGEKVILSYARGPEDIVYNCQSEVIKKAIFYIHSNISKDISLKEVADQVHLSRNYFCFLFKQGIGYRFAEYINVARINHSKTLLKASADTLELVASRCGFRSQSHFSTTFKKFMGISPMQYRKNKGAP